MVHTEKTVRDNIRNRQGKRVFYLAAGDVLTPSAREYLQSRQIEILDASLAKPDTYRLENGGEISEKPEHMTHLNAQVLVGKTHRRIRFRGVMDLLEAQLLLCCHAVPDYAGQLAEILELARHLISCDVLEEEVKIQTLCGLTQQQLRQHSHFPQDYYNQPHFMPQPSDSPAILQLNLARCTARQAELAAVDAFSDRDGLPTRLDILRALNRMSSMLYILMIRCKANQ